MVITSLSDRWGAGPGRSKACRITADPFIASSTMVKRVVRTVAFSSIRSALLVCLWVYKLKRTTVLFHCHLLAQSVLVWKKTEHPRGFLVGAFLSFNPSSGR